MTERTREATISFDQYKAIQRLLCNESGITVEIPPWPSQWVTVRFLRQRDADTFHEIMMLLADERPELFRLG